MEAAISMLCHVVEPLAHTEREWAADRSRALVEDAGRIVPCRPLNTNNSQTSPVALCGTADNSRSSGPSVRLPEVHAISALRLPSALQRHGPERASVNTPTNTTFWKHTSGPRRR